MLLCFEGIDGSGKDTHIAKLYEQLTSDGCKVVIKNFTEDDSVTGQAIRTILNTKKETGSDMRLSLIFLSELVHNVEKENGIQDYLNQGYIVLCNRYHYSTSVYAGSNDNILNLIYEVSQTLPTPDMIFYLDVTAKTGLSRISGNTDFYEQEHKLEVYRERYKKMAVNNHFITVNNQGDFTKASELIYQLTKNLIKVKGE